MKKRTNRLGHFSGGNMSGIDSEECEHFVTVKIVGVGNAGGLALESMIKAQIQGVDFITVHTDAQSLESSSAAKKIQLDVNTTKGLGVGSNPETGHTATNEALQEIEEELKDAEVVVVIVGMDGGIDTGAVHIIADAAKRAGALMTIAIVTLPFGHEDKMRMESAAEVGRTFNRGVDSLIVFCNDDLVAISAPEKEFFEIFKTGDALLTEAVRGITDLLPTGMFMGNDIADIVAVLPSDYPLAFGVGVAAGHDRALQAVQRAMRPLSRGGVDIFRASGVLVNIAGSCDMTMDDYAVVNSFIHERISDDANVKIGVVRDDELEGKIKVTVYLSKCESTLTGRH